MDHRGANKAAWRMPAPLSQSSAFGASASLPEPRDVERDQEEIVRKTPHRYRFISGLTLVLGRSGRGCGQRQTQFPVDISASEHRKHQLTSPQQDYASWRRRGRYHHLGAEKQGQTIGSPSSKSESAGLRFAAASPGAESHSPTASSRPSTGSSTGCEWNTASKSPATSSSP
jgi:hypothetical protein